MPCFLKIYSQKYDQGFDYCSSVCFAGNTMDFLTAASCPYCEHRKNCIKTNQRCTIRKFRFCIYKYHWKNRRSRKATILVMLNEGGKRILEVAENLNFYTPISTEEYWYCPVYKKISEGLCYDISNCDVLPLSDDCALPCTWDEAHKVCAVCPKYAEWGACS